MPNFVFFIYKSGQAMLSKLKLNQLYFKDTSFVNLMTKRIFNVLLVANPYDAFMLEDDGRIDEKIFNEYMNLSLRYPPRFTQVSTETEAWKQLDNTMFDLVIVMPGSDNSDTFDIARSIKQKYSHIPLVVLTPFSHGITARMEHEDLSIFEYVFCWLGNTDLLLSIIKLIAQTIKSHIYTNHGTIISNIKSTHLNLIGHLVKHLATRWIYTYNLSNNRIHIITILNHNLRCNCWHACNNSFLLHN